MKGSKDVKKNMDASPKSPLPLGLLMSTINTLTGTTSN